jgi:hypothetical protein
MDCLMKFWLVWVMGKDSIETFAEWWHGTKQKNKTDSIPVWENFLEHVRNIVIFLFFARANRRMVWEFLRSACMWLHSVLYWSGEFVFVVRDRKRWWYITRRAFSAYARACHEYDHHSMTEIPQPPHMISFPSQVPRQTATNSSLIILFFCCHSYCSDTSDFVLLFSPKILYH